MAAVGSLSQSGPSGHVSRADRQRGPVWYAKYRLPDGRQVQRKIGPAWSGRTRPPSGYFTKRQAEDDELHADWERARRRESLDPIEPLP